MQNDSSTTAKDPNFYGVVEITENYSMVIISFILNLSEHKSNWKLWSSEYSIKLFQFIIKIIK